ncbi:RNA polymerase sigma factor [Negadavirga shengliensis]|uniref:RNA polymerase sigma factor n=1 Tax=Negadavirga shengliensis TaxID=1389218 RepID=A0ABV9T5Y9_9BACT
MTYARLDDLKLWDLIVAGDKNAFGFIFKAYSNDLFKYGQKFTRDKACVEDVIQEVYLDLWQRRKSTAIRSSIKFYLLKSFRREIVRRIRQEHKSVGEVDSDFLREPSHLEHLFTQQVDDENRNRILAAIELLSDRQREAVYLKYYMGLGNDEIAHLMNMTVPSAYNLVFRALKCLKQQINNSVLLKADMK